MAEEEQVGEFSVDALPVSLTFSSTVSKAGENRYMIGVPAGFGALVRPGEAVNVECDFIFRRVRVKQAQIDAVKERLRKYRAPEAGK